MKSLSHPNIIKFYGVYESEAHLLVLMEYARGKNLSNAIQAKYRFSEKSALKIMVELLSALAECHKNGIIHRDVKPSNIIIQYLNSINNPTI